MNAGILVALLGGAAVLAAAANSKSPTTSSNSDIVQSSKSLVDIFEFYTRRMAELTTDELNELGRLNAAAKGIEFRSFLDLAKESIGTGKTNEEISKQWRRDYLLPPGVNTESGPDAFSIWASPTGQSSKNFAVPRGVELNCNLRYYAVNGADIGCYSGVYEDFFFRNCGTFYIDTEVKGHSDLMVIVDGWKKGFEDIWGAIGSDLLKTIASVASNYPGIGTVVAAGVTFLEQVGQGQSIKNASLEAGRAAVPSSLRAAYDVGVGLATTGDLDVGSALEIAMAAAIQQGYVSGDVLERYNQIKSSYEDAKAAGVEITTDLRHLGTAVNVATL